MTNRLLAAGLGLTALAWVQVAQAAPEAKDLVGAPAPDFALVSDSDQTVELCDFRGKTVVLAFFPKAFTPG